MMVRVVVSVMMIEELHNGLVLREPLEETSPAYAFRDVPEVLYNPGLESQCRVDPGMSACVAKQKLARVPNKDDLPTRSFKKRFW